MCGILPLRLETGRLVGEDECDRLCKMCSDNCVENEFHFLNNCNFYNNLRLQHFSQIDNLYIYLLCQHPRKTAKYILQAFSKRKKTFYIKIFDNIYLFLFVVPLKFMFIVYVSDL